MEYTGEIITTVQVALLVLAIPVIRLLLSWRDLLDAKAFREEEAGEKDRAMAVMAMAQNNVIKPSEARDLLVGEEDGDD